MKAYSSDKRPKVFSNSSQQKQLTPSITLNYHKKKSYVEPLPPIELSNKKKMKTEMSIDEEGFRLEMNQVEKKEKYSNKKVKNMMIRSSNFLDLYRNDTIENESNVDLVKRDHASYV